MSPTGQYGELDNVIPAVVWPLEFLHSQGHERQNPSERNTSAFGWISDDAPTSRTKLRPWFKPVIAWTIHEPRTHPVGIPGWAACL